ncbi:hypothetical protein [Streptomyces flavofungini]|uniref:hypothetical protein n=1 Tax=Streptomyces flavofungini TaxID=68200 RepID=UPI0034DF5224
MVTESVRGLAHFAVRRVRGVLDIVEDTADALTRAVIGAVLDRVDLDALVARVDAERIADRIDVNRVADRVDVDRIADRVDIEAVIARIDLVGLTRDVLDEIDLGQIVRDTGGGMTQESVTAIRLLAHRGDRGTNRLADRLLGRSRSAGPEERVNGTDRSAQGARGRPRAEERPPGAADR